MVRMPMQPALDMPRLCQESYLHPGTSLRVTWAGLRDQVENKPEKVMKREKLKLCRITYSFLKN